MSQDAQEYTTKNLHEFSLNNWEFKPLVIQDKILQIPTTPDELFSIILNNYPNDPCSSKGLYIDGKYHELAGSCFCPTKEDGSFSGYDKRIRSLINEEYALVIGRIELSESLWEWTYLFLKQLHSALGYLHNGHFHTIFYGNYNSVGLGVYCNPYPPEGVFYFPLVDEEKIILWEPEYVKMHPSIIFSRKYDEFIEGSLILKAKPGGIIYWPSDRWYTGTSKAESVSLVMIMNASNNFALPLAKFLVKEIDSFYKNSLKRSFLKAVIDMSFGISIGLKKKFKNLEYSWENSFKAQFLKNINNSSLFDLVREKEQANKAFFNPKDLQDSAEKIPDAIKLAATPFKGILDSSIIERASIKLWLRMLTCYGYTPLPKPQNTLYKELTIDNYLQICPEHVILWRRIGETELIICVKGHFIQLSYHPIFQPLIKCLNTGEVYSVRELLKHSNHIINGSESTEYIEKDVLTFLNQLLCNRGIKVIKK